MCPYSRRTQTSGFPPARLTATTRSPHAPPMTRFSACLCLLLVLSATSVPLHAEASSDDRTELIRVGLTIAGAATGLCVGAATGIAFSQDAIDTPLSDTLVLTIPVAATGAATGALAGAWMADVTLRRQPSFFFSIIEGAGIGMLSGAFVGATTFSLNFAIAAPLLDMPEGYWGEPPLPLPLMAAVSGGFWGAFFGAIAGAIIVPLIVLYMGF